MSGKLELRRESELTLAADSLLLNQPAPGGPGSGLDRKGKARAAPGEGADFLALNLDGDGKATSGQHADAGGYQQMQLVEQQVGWTDVGARHGLSAATAIAPATLSLALPLANARSHRTTTSNRARPPSSPSNPPSRN